MKTQDIKAAKKRRKYNRNSAPYILALGLVVVVVLLVFSYFYYQRLIRQATDALGEDNKSFSRHYALICDTKDSDVWDEIYQYMQEEANNNDAYVELMTPDESNKYLMSDLMDISIAQKVDGIILQCMEEEGLEDKINEAVEAGIPVVTVLSDAPSTGRISFVGTSPYTVAGLYADAMIEEIPKKYEPGESILVAVVLTEDSIDREQYQQFSEINTRLTTELPDYKITVSAVRTNAEEDFYYEEKIRDLYRGSDIPNYVVSFNSIVTDAVYQTVIDYNAANTTNILGSYLSPTTKTGLIKNAVIGTLMPDTKQISSYAVEALTEYIEDGHTNAYFGINVSLLKKGDLPDEK